MTLGVIILVCFAAISYANYMQNKRLSVDPSSYGPLLEMIAKVESKDNYNAYFGNAGNATIDFTNMTITEVLEWQQNHINEGNFSSAVGRYQIVNTTLQGLLANTEIDPNTKFDKSTQDYLAMKLLERRGAEQYVNQELTKEQFAANLAMEWAALPKVIGDDPSKSYYGNDGVNKALVTVGDVLNAVSVISPK